MSEESNDQYDKELDDEALAEHRMRMRFDWSDLIEDLIQEGQERGAFDNLPGQGKPLDLRRNPYGVEWELAHKLMKDNDVLPPWIAKRKLIMAQIDQMRGDIARAWRRHEQAFRFAQGKGQQSALSLSWDGAWRRWQIQLEHINKQIRDYNLGRPSEGLEMVTLELEREIARAGAQRTLG